LDFCKKAGLRIMAGTVFTHSNLHSEGIKRLIDYVTKNRLTLIINPAVPTGRWHDNLDVVLNEEDQVYVRKLIDENPYLRSDKDSAMKGYGCPAITEKIYITTYGDVTGCDFVQIKFGNVRGKSLKEIRDSAISTGLMTECSPLCYAAEDREFIDKYMSQLGSNVPKPYEEVSSFKN
jgi:MoaA/NifB/PqqE/SkfB family radical SAM enzyme